MAKHSAKKKGAFFDASLRASEIRYRRLFEAAQDGILILDAKTGAITDVNPFLIEMLGYSREEFIQKKLWEVGAFQDIKASQEAFQTLQKKTYIRYKDLPLRAKDGKLIPVEFVSNVYLAGGEHVIQCNIRDISERKHVQEALQKSEARFREQSVRDHLTGLFNRRYMEETLEREMIRATRLQLPLGVIMLDVDGFKHQNDTHGHAAGDAILRALGSLLLKHVRGEDIPCRYGGDEFIIVMPGASRTVTHDRAGLLREQAGRMRILFEEDKLLVIRISLGVAVFPEDGDTCITVLRAADQAMYRAKREGCGLVAVANRNPQHRFTVREILEKPTADH